jgi:hypothetical protein
MGHKACAFCAAADPPLAWPWVQLPVYRWVLPQVPLLTILWGLLSVLLLE